MLARPVKQYLRTIGLIVLVICINSQVSYAQEGYEAFSVAARGAGGEYSVLSRGVNAIGLNPALLGLEPENRIQISVLPFSGFGLDAGSSFRDVGALSTVFGNSNSFVGNNTSDRVDSLLSNNKMSGRGDVEVLGLYYYAPDIGGFGLSWTTHAALRTVIPQSFLDFFGVAAASNLTSGSPLAANNFDLQGLWYSEYGLSFGRQVIGYSLHDSTEAFLGSLSVGGALKYVAGIGYAGLQPGNSLQINQLNDATEIRVNYSMQFAYPDAFDPKNVPNRFNFQFLSSATAGSGIGADIGVHAGFFRSRTGQNALSIGASITDIGSITWNKNTSVRSVSNLIDTISHQGLDSSTVNHSLAPIAGKLSNVSSFTTPLPTAMRIGAALDLDAIGIAIAGTSMTFAAEYADGLTTTVGALQSPRIGFGVLLDHPGNLFSVRGGVGYTSQPGNSGLSLGIGTTILRRVAIDAATSNLTQLLGNSGSIDAVFSVRVLLD